MERSQRRSPLGMRSAPAGAVKFVLSGRGAHLLTLMLMVGPWSCDDGVPGASGDATPAADSAMMVPDAVVSPDLGPPDAAAHLFPCEAVAPESAVRRPGPQGDGTSVSVRGRGLSPTGENIQVRGMPGNVVMHPSGRWAYVITHGRTDRGILVLSTDDFGVQQDVDLGEAYYGLALTAAGDRLFASGGDNAVVAVFEVGEDGGLTQQPDIQTGGYPSGMALSADERALWVGQFQTEAVLEVKVDTGEVRREFPLPAIPWEVRYVAAVHTLFVGNLSGSEVYAINPDDGTILARIPIHTAPAGMAVSADGARIWVAVSGGDTVAAIDTTSLEVVAMAPVAAEGPLDDDGDPLANSNVNALAYDPVGDRLYAARGADDAVAVLDGTTLEFLGAFPTGEYPAGIAITPDGQRMVVAEARGGEPGPSEGRSPKEAISGSASLVTLTALDLAASSTQVDANLRRPMTAFPFQCDGFFPIPTRPDQASPIEHVFLVVKENKTFDCIFGDLDDMDAEVDPDLVRYGEDITPNLHALARQFALSDNFYAEVEDSDVGHVLLTATHLTELVHRIWMEKDRSGQIPEGYQISEGARPAEGNFFTHLMDHDVSFRVYGEIVGMFATARTRPGTPLDYSDLDYPGGPFVNYEVTDEEKMRHVISRLEAGEVAQFTYIALPNDHTVGTRAGYPVPESMVADNDYAVGLLVAYLAQSPLWAKSAVIVLQDDPQGCEDHVDVHRSFVLVASPWAKRGYISHAHASFMSVFATIERILGVPPMGRGDATAAPLWDLFDAGGEPTPYIAVPRRVPETFNGADFPGARLSEQMDFRGPDRNPALAVVLDAYRLWRMGRITKEEAQRRIDQPRLPWARWVALLEEAFEERFAFDRDFRRYQAYLARQAARKARGDAPESRGRRGTAPR